MKYADITRIRDAGLITSEQHARIAEHFQLKEDSSRFLTIISVFGALLVASGIVLVISANWEDIPRGVKIACGLLLMCGAHAGGWVLHRRGSYLKTAEALHLAGSCLFLANIALIGQIYHISSRPPNAFLAWWLGIVALPWLLKSTPQHVLSLVAFSIWFATEVNEQNGPLGFAHDGTQLVLYALLAGVYIGLGTLLQRTKWHQFGPITERLGLGGLLICTFILTWGVLRQPSWVDAGNRMAFVLFLGIGVLALLVAGSGALRLTEMTPQWRWTWAAALAALLLLLMGGVFFAPSYNTFEFIGGAQRWMWTSALFFFCLTTIRVGLERRQEFMVNLGVTFVALTAVSAYLLLFGSMAVTGFMFVLSGLFLIGFGIYLEKKRRSLLKELWAEGGNGAAPEASTSRGGVTL